MAGRVTGEGRRVRILSLTRTRSAAFTRAIEAIRGGRLVVLPTDTVYGLAADPFQPGATDAVFRAKGRSRSLPLPVMVADAAQAWALCAEVPPRAGRLASSWWPGPLTLLLPLAEGLDVHLGDADGRIAIRVPAHDDARELLSRSGPLAVTSANVSGEPTPSTVKEIKARLGEAVEVYLDGGPAPGDVPSTIVDVTGDQPVIVREGAVPIADIERVLSTEEPGP